MVCHLFRRCPRARHQVAGLVDVPVEARGGKPQCAGFESRAGQPAHLGHVCGRRIVVAALAHDVVAHGHVRYLGPHVHGVRGVDAVEIFGERFPAPGNAVMERGAGNVLHAFHELHQLVLGAGPHRRETDAAIAHDDRGDAVPAARGDLLVPADLAVVVGVDVDETRGQQLAPGIDDAPGLRRAAPRGRNLGDLPAVDDDIPAPCRERRCRQRWLRS